MPSLKRFFIGIDPGASGGIAVIDQWSRVEFANKLPDTEWDVWELIASSPQEKTRAVLEQIIPGFPGSGKAQIAKLYGSYRQLRGFLVAAEIPFETVLPTKWTSFFGLHKKKGEGKTAWKNRLKARAQELFSGTKVTLATADALLLAEYCRCSELGIKSP